MATFVILRHPVTISVTDFINPFNLMNKFDCKIKPASFIFNTKELFNE